MAHIFDVIFEILKVHEHISEGVTIPAGLYSHCEATGLLMLEIV